MELSDLSLQIPPAKKYLGVLGIYVYLFLQSLFNA